MALPTEAAVAQPVQLVQTLAKQEPQQQPSAEETLTVAQGSAPLATAPVAARAVPSFDCGSALSPQETMICASDELSKLDVDLSHAYQTAMSEPARAASLREGQRNWVKQVRNACETEDCLARIYQARIRELTLL